jgi:hypothetical protein
MENRYGEVTWPLQVVTSINEASLLATAERRNCGARHAVHVTQFLDY